MTRELLGLIAVSAGVWTTLSAAAWWLIKPRFQKAVFAALQDNPGEWRRWNDAQYATEMTASRAAEALGERTHSAVEQIQRDLALHREELREHRERTEVFWRDMAHLPAAMENIAAALREGSAAQREISDRLNATQIEVAVLKGQSSAR